MHMKNAILGLVLLAAVSFAQVPTVSPEMWNNYAATCCQYNSVYYLADEMEGGADYVMYYDDDCGYAYDFFGFPYPDTEELDGLMWDDRGNVREAFQDAMFACGEFGETSQECTSAKSYFYMVSRNARTSFTESKLSYMFAARTSVWTYLTNQCSGDGESASYVRSVLLESSAMYRECRAVCSTPFAMDCADWCAGPMDIGDPDPPDIE